jgi:hypothetical protein
MKLLASFLVLFVLANADVSELRKLYPNAASSEANAKAFDAKVADVTEKSDPVLAAYKGAAQTLLAKFSNNLPDKISYMKAGAHLIDGAAVAEKSNIEIRMIRLSVQESVPLIVNYRKNKKEDKAFILAHYQQSGPVREYIANFIQRSESFTAAEKQAVK